MTKYIVFGGKCAVSIDYDSKNRAVACLFDEYRHHLLDSGYSLPIVGVIRVFDNVRKPSSAVLLHDGRMYVDGKVLYCADGPSYVRISLSEVTFCLDIDSMTGYGLLMTVLQPLLNWYLPKYGLAFLHTASFKYRDEVYAISGLGGTGKTEVMLEALQRGAQYLSDDLCLFDKDGNICPYLRKISLHDYPFNDEQLDRFNLNKRQYHLMMYCKDKPGRITQYLYQRYRGRFKISFDYTAVSSVKVEYADKSFPVKVHYWLDATDKTEFKVLSAEDFIRKMTFCMQNEFRPYCDFDGCFGIVYDFWQKKRNEHNRLLAEILNKIEITGLSIRTGAYNELAELILNY